MTGFFYYQRRSVRPSLADTREMGLGYAFAAEPEARECQANTPDGARGYVFADGKRVDSVKMDRDAQVWRKMPGKDVWVGYWKDQKPTPADLARAEQLAGFNIKMADGHEWLIPVVRAFDGDTGTAVPVLPTLYALDEQGQLTRGEVQAAHRWLWDLTEPAWNAMVTEGEVSDQSMLETACKLIGANYVVDVVELAGLLQVFSPQLSPVGVVSLALDYFTWSEWATAKKKTTNPPPPDADSDTSPGEMDALHATRQPVLTS